MNRPTAPLQHRIKLSQLRLLVHIAESGSLLQASERLHITQPAATKALKQLESAVGSPLVTRGSSGSMLTAVGEILYRRARLILAELRDVEEELAVFHTGGSGSLTVGALLVAAPRLLPAALERMARDHPKVTVRVIEGSSDALFPDLQAGKIDLLVGRFWPGADPGMVSEVLYESRLAVVVRAGHPLATRRKLVLRDLAQANWIMPPNDTHFRVALEEAFRHAGCRMPSHSVETTSFLTIRTLLLSTDMLCALPVETLQSDAQLGLIKVLPVSLAARLPPVGIVRNAHRTLVPAAATFMACLRESGRQTAQELETVAAPQRRSSRPVLR